MNYTIALASTLKPVIDPRVYEKIGRSLARNNQYKVHIFGSYPTEKSRYPNLSLHPILIKRSQLFKRLIHPWRMYRQIIKVKPNLLIVTTHELLFVGVVLKLVTGCKLIYDIQENYFNNIIFQRNYKWGLRHIMSLLIRTREIIYSGFYDHFILAEQCYQDELKFIGKRYTIIENKYAPPEKPLVFKKQYKNTFLLSGTLSQEYGVLDALRFFLQLPENEFDLTLIGHCPLPSTLDEIKQITHGLDNVNNLVSREPVPHEKILEQIGDKTVGLLPYRYNKSTRNKVPTKLYEYIGMRIPILISPNPTWKGIIDKYGAGFIVDFSSPPHIDTIRNSFTLNCRSLSIDLKDVMWFNEEKSLQNLIQGIF